ncbi:MAG: DMT family transporter [Candidatus Competibacteraceae bacterium]|nr:DMT family transporter [Candidatus Competibacteraceae bacterium]MCB1814970.1 DMT family transporter [Candidatus Competibacteraceae bacterium]
MLLSTALLSCMHGLVRYVSHTLHPFEIAFFRNLFGLAVVLPLVWRAGAAGFVTKRPGLQVLRGVIGMGAMLGWFYGLSVVPIAGATALSFTAAIFASLGAALFLGERMRLRRWSAVIIGFLGALIVLRPGMETISIGALAILFSSMCWGSNIVIVKRLSQTDNTVSIVVWMSMMLTVFSIFPALFVWQWPTMPELGWLLLLGTLGTGGHLAMVTALKLVDATQIMPLDFSRLIWTSVLGYLVFAEIPDIWTWVGGTVIFASAAFITYREAKLKRPGLAVPRQ